MSEKKDRVVWHSLNEVNVDRVEELHFLLNKLRPAGLILNHMVVNSTLIPTCTLRVQVMKSDIPALEHAKDAILNPEPVEV